MPITSKEEAFKILDTQKWGIPFEAIEFLYNHPKDEEIFNKICYSLTHTHDEDVYYDETNDYLYNTPLWYSIIAEKYLDIKLIDPLLAIFNPDYDAWDMLAEQAMYVMAKIAQSFPEEAPIKFLEATEEAIKIHKAQPNIFNYLHVLEPLRYLNLEQHGNRLLKLLRNSNPLQDGVAGLVADLDYKAAIPILKDLIDFMKMDHPEYMYDSLLQSSMIEYVEALSRLQGKNTETFPKPYHLTRGSWKKHYKGLEDLFRKPK